MEDDDTQKKILHDEDFVNLRRFDFSIKEVMKRYPEGAPDRLIAQALGLGEDEIETRYQEIVGTLRDLMKVDFDEED